MSATRHTGTDMVVAVSQARQGRLKLLDQAVQAVCARRGAGQPIDVLAEARSDALLDIGKLIGKEQKSETIAMQVGTIVRRALYRANGRKVKYAMTEVVRLDDPDTIVEATSPSAEDLYLVHLELERAKAGIDDLARTDPRAHLVLKAILNDDDHVEALRKVYGDKDAKNAAVILFRARRALEKITSSRKDPS